MSSVGVVLCHDDRVVAEQVSDAIEQAPDLFVAATSLDAAAGAAIVAGGDALLRLGPQPRPVIALAGDDLVRSARAALHAGAADIVRWPEEADRLPGAIRFAVGARARAAAPRGRVIAVAGARGGTGTSTFTAALAASLGALIVDLDGGQRAFSDAEPGRIRGALADVTADAFEAALVPHAAGPRALHVPHGCAPSGVHGLLRAARDASPYTVIDAGRCVEPGAHTAVAAADARVLVLADDVASVRGMQGLHASVGRQWLYVIRRRRRGGVALRDLRAAIGGDIDAVIRDDAALARTVDLGALPARPTRTLRAAAKLAAAVKEGWA